MLSTTNKTAESKDRAMINARRVELCSSGLWMKKEALEFFCFYSSGKVEEACNKKFRISFVTKDTQGTLKECIFVYFYIFRMKSKAFPLVLLQ